MNVPISLRATSQEPAVDPEGTIPAPQGPTLLHRTLSEAVLEAGQRRSPSYLRTVVNRVTQEGTEILERLGLQPGREESLPEGQRFRLDDTTARRWEVTARRISRAAMAVVVVALLAALLRMTMILSLPVWKIWKIAGIAAFIIGLLARHAELQLAAQQRAAQAEQSDAGTSCEIRPPRLEEPAQGSGT